MRLRAVDSGNVFSRAAKNVWVLKGGAVYDGPVEGPDWPFRRLGPLRGVFPLLVDKVGGPEFCREELELESLEGRWLPGSRGCDRDISLAKASDGGSP